jgi:hypothetical protein
MQAQAEAATVETRANRTIYYPRNLTTQNNAQEERNTSPM